MKFEQAMTLYLKNYASTKTHTSRARRNDAAYFLAAWGNKNLRVVTVSTITEWRDRRLQIEAPATVMRRLATLRHFYSTLGDKNPAREVPFPILPETTPDWFTVSESARLREVACVGTSTFIQLRSALILELGLSQGLRCKEIRLLTAAQIDLYEKKILKAWGKGSRYFTKPLHSRVAELLERYYRYRELEIAKHDAGFLTLTPQKKLSYPVIVSTYGAKQAHPRTYEMSEKTIWRTIRRIGDLANVPRSRTHRLRHAFVKRITDACGILAAAEHARHSNPKTTMRYAQSSFDESRNSIEHA